jgi:hypothetical protein
MSATQPLTFDRCRKRLKKQTKQLIFSGLGASTKDHSPEVLVLYLERPARKSARRIAFEEGASDTAT